MKCSLCKNSVETFKIVKGKEYFKCKQCYGIMLGAKDYLSCDKEKKRYQEHNNDVEGKGYQQFVFPMVTRVIEAYGHDHIGLDFGSGTGPVISKLLKDKGYKIVLYDPYFANNSKVLETSYDYIVCCEVVEHFYNPGQEFKGLRKLLKEGGTLYLKTNIYKPYIDFKSWRYRDDSTHVFFYQKETFEWIKGHYKFLDLEIDTQNNIITLGG